MDTCKEKIVEEKCEKKDMQTPKISIIVPIHNTPKDVLDECLHCLVHQNFEGYELICVDDCSLKAETIGIESIYEDKYSNIVKMYHLKNNIGAAEARNFGLRNAQGDYCIFLDSDDVFSPNFLAKLYGKIVKKDSDICLCGYSLFKEEKHEKIIIDRAYLDFEYEDIKGCEDMLVRIPASGWNKLCRTSYLRQNNINFQSLKSDNDMYFALKSVLCTERICVLHDCELMLYRYNTDFQISANMNPLNMFSAIQKLFIEVGELPLYDNAFSMIAYYSIFTGVFEIRNCKVEDNARRFYELLKKSFIDSFPDFKDDRCNLYVDYWKKNDFESRWFDDIGNYLKQLQENTMLADKLIRIGRPIYIWGRGKRGNAFKIWCKGQNIRIKGICDKKNCNIGEKDEHNIEIVSTSVVESMKGFIVATNHEIYNTLIAGIDNAYIMDLEDFCPL